MLWGTGHEDSGERPLAALEIHSIHIQCSRELSVAMAYGYHFK